MRIRSEVKDYYDCVQRHNHGSDDIFYNRFPSEMLTTEIVPYHLHCRDSGFFAKTIIIGFCGKYYPLFQISTISGVNDKEKCCYSVEDVQNFAKDTFSKKYFEQFTNQEYGNGFKKGFDKIDIQLKELKTDFFEIAPLFVMQEDRDWVQQRNSHSWPKRPTKLKFNCMLKDFDFYRIFDCNQAFQELTMWLNNKAVPMKPIPDISDKDMIMAKGFDKFSFRKDKK